MCLLMRNPIASAAIQGYLSDRPKISEWLSTKKPETIRLYITQIKRFEQTTQTTLETLLDQLDNHQIKPTTIRTQIIQATRTLSNANQVVTDAAIRSFFKYWATALPTTSIKYEETQTYKPYTKTELQKLLGFTDKLLEKLYITIGAETGLRANTILQLTYGHVQEDLNKATNSVAVRLEPRFHKGRKKSGYPFIGKRAIELLKQAIEEARVKTDPSARLFPYTDDSIRKIIKVAKRKAHLDPTIHPIHGLRSYFEAQLIAAGTHPSYIKMLHGRFDDTDAKHYTPRDIETLRPEYEHAYPHLDFLNNTLQQTQELSTKQTELQDIINGQNQRIQRLEQMIQRGHEADSGILAILQSPTALRRIATFAEHAHSKKIAEQALAALDALHYPQTYENIQLATRAYFEANPQLTKELRNKHPELTDPAEDQKILTELKRALPTGCDLG